MVKRGVALTTVRKFAQGLAFVVPAVCMLACGVLTPAAGQQAANVPLLVGLLSVGFAFGAWSRAGLYCNHQVGLRSTGVGLSSLFGASWGQHSCGTGKQCLSLPQHASRPNMIIESLCSKTGLSISAGWRLIIRMLLQTSSVFPGC